MKMSSRILTEERERERERKRERERERQTDRHAYEKKTRYIYTEKASQPCS